MKLPEDPYMLLSFVNMKLRDGEYESLSELAEAFNSSEQDITSILKGAGFEFIENLKQFR